MNISKEIPQHENSLKDHEGNSSEKHFPRQKLKEECQTMEFPFGQKTSVKSLF